MASTETLMDNGIVKSKPTQETRSIEFGVRKGIASLLLGIQRVKWMLIATPMVVINPFSGNERQATRATYCSFQLSDSSLKLGYGRSHRRDTQKR